MGLVMAILRETMEVAGSVLMGVAAAAAAMEMIMAVVVQSVVRIVAFPEGTVQMQKVPRPFFFFALLFSALTTICRAPLSGPQHDKQVKLEERRPRLLRLLWSPWQSIHNFLRRVKELSRNASILPF
jgi:hypothetical protein